MNTALSATLIGEAGQADAEKRARGCTRPVRLVGSTDLVDRGTGEARPIYSSSSELDGTTYVRCGNRRAAVCPSCSREYKGDAWHVLMCGLAGGKGIPASVADHPCTFATLTAPSFGAVHGLRNKGPCRARRDRPICRHGRPAWCNRRHTDDDRLLGQPLCVDCYDYLAHVVWQWHAPELWRRFTIALQRSLAAKCGLSVKSFRKRCKISYSKVVEFQARGAVHMHALIRLDGPQGPDGPASDLPLSTGDLEEAIHAVSGRVVVDSKPLADGTVYELRWGVQVDCRSVRETARRGGSHSSSVVHPEQVASYLAKYLTKATEDFGLTRQVTSAQAVPVGVSRHAVALIQTAERLAGEGDGYARLLAHLGNLGYRGHPITKSRAYSVTFGQIRRSRRFFRRKPAALAADSDIRRVLDVDDDLPDGFVVMSSWVFVGQGYLDLDSAAAAVRSAAWTRSR
ncbi:MAG: replication initiation protein [Propionibacteriales bacterium]|nr:replication initiation protein [Propionibacteriales bacterium]